MTRATRPRTAGPSPCRLSRWRAALNAPRNAKRPGPTGEQPRPREPAPRKKGLTRFHEQGHPSICFTNGQPGATPMPTTAAGDADGRGAGGKRLFSMITEHSFLVVLLDKPRSQT